MLSKIAISVVLGCCLLATGVAQAEEPLYGQSVDKTKWWSVSQPAGTPPADGYIQLRSGDPFVRKNKNGSFEFCMQHDHIPWWSGKVPSYCKLWGSAAEFVKKTNGPSVEYVGMGVSYSYLILFHRVVPALQAGQ